VEKIKNILIVASSARLLAQWAKSEGFLPLAIDCFADVDTQETALDSVKVHELTVKHVKEAASAFKKQYIISYVIYGSGLESHQETLKWLEQNFTVIGNSFAVFASIQNKASFFKLLKQQGIDCPEISFQQPCDSQNWLIKPLNGEGGIGVKKYAGESNSCYWQKYCFGTARSVLFIAKDSKYEIIGFHKQFATQINDHPFIFSGVMTQPEINKGIVKTLTAILDILVNKYSLKGVGSLDFIEKNNQCFVLEINARPSASLNLYDSGLFSKHIDSCTHENGAFASSGRCETKSSLPNAPNLYRAFKILFAETDIIIDRQMSWPSWVSDIPQDSSIINTGSPICSIIAGGKNERQVEDLLLFRQQQLTKLLT